MTFEDIMNRAIKNGNYSPLTLDCNNEKSLDLLSDGITAVVMERRAGMWFEVDRFERETYFKSGHWSDCDIDRALNGPF